MSIGMLKDELAPYVLNDCKNYALSLVSTTCIITYIKDPLICIHIFYISIMTTGLRLPLCCLRPAALL